MSGDEFEFDADKLCEEMRQELAWERQEHLRDLIQEFKQYAGER